MVDVEKINKKYRRASPVGQFQTTAGKFASDLLELAELQGKLFKADAKLTLNQSSILCVALSLKALSKTSRQFKRSTEEFSKNVEWAKDVFHGVSSR